MKVRTLPRDEWARIDDPGLEIVLSRMFPRDARVVAVENKAGEIVARMAVLSIPHLESFWIAKSAYGNPGITRALLRACVEQAEASGQGCVYVNSDCEEMSATLTRLGGVRMPVETYLLPLRTLKEARCRNDQSSRRKVKDKEAECRKQ